MEFSPTFALLAKFNIGLQTAPKNEDDVLDVSRYLGVELPDSGLEDRILVLSKELALQNGFLSTQLESETIFTSKEYRKSLFIREIVANNRINRKNRSNLIKTHE